MQPRKTCMLLDKNLTTYSYSGLTLKGVEFPEEFSKVRERLMRYLPKEHPKPNAALCNLYMDGKHYIGQHSDKETDLVPNTCIVSLSLGATRHFDIHSRNNKDGNYRLDLSSGALLVMYPGMQQFYTHGVPKELKVKEPRINITFRVAQN